MLDEVEVLALKVSHLIPFIDLVVRIVSKFHQSLNTFTQVTLKFSCGSLLPYMSFFIFC